MKYTKTSEPGSNRKLLTLREYKILCAVLAIDITDEELAQIMDQLVDLTKGGIAVVAHGAIGFVKEYANNPSIVFLDCGTLQAGELELKVPHNTRAFIITDGLPDWHYTWITSYARRKQVPFLVRKTTQAIYDTIKSFFPNGNEAKVSLEEVKETQNKGKLNSLIQFIDWNKSNTENARELIRKATQAGIRTTEASLAQLVSNQRRKRTGVTAVPKSVRSQLDVSVELLDKMIEDLTAMRDYLINTTEENRLLKQKLDRFKKAMED